MINMQNIGPPMPMIGSTGRPENTEVNSGFRGGADRFADKLQTVAEPNGSQDVQKADLKDTKAPLPTGSKVSGQKTKGDSATQKFMDSMESELGVTPERILAALAVMKPTEISSPAANTADAFVENLSLENFDKTKATQIYNQFLVDKGVLAPLDPSSIALHGTATNLHNIAPKEVLSERPFLETSAPEKSVLEKPVLEKPFLDKSTLENSALENLNLDKVIGAEVQAKTLPEGFEMATFQNSEPAQTLSRGSGLEKAPSNLQTTDLQFVGELDEQGDSNFDNDLVAMANDSESELGADSTELNTEVPVSAKEKSSSVRTRKNTAGENAKQTDLPLNSFQRRQKLNDSIDRMNDSFFMQSRMQAQSKVKLNTATPEEAPTEVLPFDRNFKVTRNTDGDIQGWKQQEGFSFPGVVEGRPVLPTSQLKGDASGEFGTSLEGEALEEEVLSADTDDFQSQVFGRLNAEWEPSKANNANIAQPTQAFDMTNADKVKNMQRLIENARVLAQDGGGEMRMKLAPEGLGEIQLKVAVVNGKVDLEIKSQNHEAKKMLESSLNELKSTLSHHSLTVDKVKVDVGTQDSLSSNDSFLKQFQMNEGQEQARQFLHQFRENNLSQRQNMFDLPGFKNYQPERGEDLKPISNGPVRPRGFDRNKGQGLNLVA